MTDSKTKTNTDESVKTAASDWTVEKKKRKRKPRKKTIIAEKTWATEKQVIKELASSQVSETPVVTSPAESISEKEIEHTVAWIDDLQAYIASKKSVVPEKTMPTTNDLLAADWTNLLTVPGIFAVVPHAKWDHKLVFKKDQIPTWLLDDPKNRIPWTLYKKNGAPIYFVNLVMKEHPTLRDARWNNYDVWIIDDEKQLNEQLQSIKNGVWWWENFGSPIIAWKEIPNTTNAIAQTDTATPWQNTETLVPEATITTEESPNNPEGITEETETQTNDNTVVNTETEEADEKWGDETQTTATPTEIEPTETETIPQNDATPEEEHHPFTTPNEEITTPETESTESTQEAESHPFVIPDIAIPEEPAIDMTTLEKIDTTLQWDTEGVSLNFHDSIAETVPEEHNEPIEEIPTQSSDNIAPTEETGVVDLTFDHQDTEIQTTPESQNTPQAVIDLPEIPLTAASESNQTPENNQEAWWSLFTPITGEAVTSTNDAEFNLDDLQIEEVVNDTAPKPSQEIATTPPLWESVLWTNNATQTVNQDTTVHVSQNTPTQAPETKKWIPMATKLRLIWFVIIILCLGIIAFVMFPKNQWEKTDDAWTVDTEIENSVIDEGTIDDTNPIDPELNPDENPVDENPIDENPIDDTTNPDVDPSNTVPNENTWPSWSEVEDENTPSDNEQDTTVPQWSLTITELKIKLEAQQADARKMLNVAKLIDNKAAIKFSLAANLKAGNVLDRIDNDPTITADDVASEVETIDRYLEEASKLVE